jgi:hypothetical protein
VGALGTTLVVFALLLANTFATHSERKFKWRYWMDFVAATRTYLDETWGDASSQEGDPDRIEWAKKFVERRVEQAHIKKWQFWKTIGVKPFLEVREELPFVPRSEDPGRARLLALGFRVLGGISPFLLVYLGALSLVPVAAWMAWEFLDAGFPVLGTVFPLCAASLTYTAQTLALPYSAVAFYLIALLGILPLATYGVAGRGRIPAFFFVRVACAGLLLAGCNLCRSDVIGLAPSYCAAALFATWRLFSDRRRRILFGVTALALLLLPCALLRPPEHHNVWLSVWEGLGDFDRTKGHQWSDRAATAALRSAGVTTSRMKIGLIVSTPEGEAFFKGSVLQDIASDPVWYARILCERLFAILTLRHFPSLDPVFPLGAVPTDPPDRILVRGLLLPVPGWLLVLPTWGLFAVAFVRDATPRLRAGLLVLFCMALGGIPVPALLSTFAASEIQGFFLVYYAGLCLTLDLAFAAALAAWRRRGGAAAPLAGVQ